MFSGNFQEGRPNTIVDLPGKEKVAFRLFLQLMYPLENGKYPKCLRETLTKVLVYAEEYLVPSVTQHVDNILYFQHYLGKNPYASSKNIFSHLLRDLKMCDNYKLQASRKALISHILIAEQTYDSFSLADAVGFKVLDGESKFQLLAG